MDMIVQNVSVHGSGQTDLTFTCPRADVARAEETIRSEQAEIGFEDVATDSDIAKISLVGAGMRSHPGVTATFFACLADAGLNIEMISTSEIRISVIVREIDLEKGVKAAHTAFELDADSDAVVYGGSGR